MRPLRSEYPDYFHNYIPLVRQDNVQDAIAAAKNNVLELIGSIAPSLEDHAYAENKWTIKQVLIHCMDTERIFSTRALGFARGETQKALSFDENIYAAHSRAAQRSLKDIAEEYEAVTNATFLLFRSFDEETLNITGRLPAGPATVNAMGFAICGHTLHHMAVIRERYLKNNAAN